MWIITGTGRSGTSLVSQLLHAAGGDFGPAECLQAPDSANPRGYYEQQEINAINIRLLLGNRVDPNLQFRPPRGPVERARLAAQHALYMRSASAARQARRGQPHLARVAELGDRYRGLFVKDPRFSRTLRFWKDHCDIEGVIFCYRAPHQVARSIQCAYGAPYRVALREWHQRVAAFLEDLDGLPAHLVDHGRLVGESGTSREEVARLLGLLEQPLDSPGGVAARVLDPDLSGTSSPSGSVPRRTRTLWRRLQALHPANAERMPASTVEGPA